MNFNLRIIALLLFALPGVAHGAADSAVIHFIWNVQGDITSDDCSSINDSSAALWEGLAEISKDSASLIVDLGNSFYPGRLSRFSYGSVVNELFNQMHISIKSIGVKDFFQGRERLELLRQRAQYTFLSSNIVDNKTKRPLFKQLLSRSPGGIPVRIISALAPKELLTSKTMYRDGVEIAEPVGCLKSLLSSSPDSVRPFTICLCDRQTLEQFPLLLDFDGIDLFACGLPRFDPAKSRSPRESILANGKRVVYIPPFSDGVGRLVVTASRGHPALAGRFSVYRKDSMQPVPPQSRFFAELVGKWFALYRKENDSVVARVSEPLAKNQTETVGNLIRERTHADLACFEASLVTDAKIPPCITKQDLDRLITASPDLLVWSLSGSDINRMRRIESVKWIGADAKPGIVGREIYSVVLTENAFGLIMEALGGSGGLPKPEYLFMSLIEAVTEQLSARKSQTYEFKDLRLRWRRFGEASAGISLQSMSVGNRRDVTELSGVSYEPYSNWNIDLKIPLSFYNPWNRIDLSTDIDYSSSNSSIERNLLECKLDYTYNSDWLINGYASVDYESFVIKQQNEDMPVQMRTTAGAMTDPGTWTFKLGFGAEKILSSSRPNPFLSFGDILAGDNGDAWNPAFELTAEGSQSISDLLRLWKPNIPPDRDIDADISWKNVLSLPPELRTYPPNIFIFFQIFLARGIFFEYIYP
jgi:hypothetical protein